MFGLQSFYSKYRLETRTFFR